jgi:hypothetical protein
MIKKPEVIKLKFKKTEVKPFFKFLCYLGLGHQPSIQGFIAFQVKIL